MVIQYNILKEIEPEDIVDGVVIVPDNVVSIDKNAFYNNSNIREIVLPNGLVHIEESAFAKCNNLEKINLPKSLRTIGHKAFFLCEKLNISEIPNSVTSIGMEAFSGCSSIETIQLPENLKKIQTGTFSSCTKLNKIIFPKQLQEIDNTAFFRCSALEKIEVPDTVKTMGHSVFAGCKNLKTAKISKGLNTLKTSTFSQCVLLEDVILPETFKHIGHGCFDNCQSLKNINFPKSLEIIESKAFHNCSSLESIVLPPKIKSIEKETFRGCINLENVTLPKGLKTIGEGAFMVCKSLENIEIPDSVTSVESYAFCDCSLLENIKFSQNLIDIGTYSFKNCTNLRDFVLPESLKYIQDEAFKNCLLIENVTLPASVEYIGKNVFANCSYLHNVQIDCKDFPTLPEGTFDGCYSLSSVKLNDGLVSLGKNCFKNCKALTSIDFPKSLINIGERSFENSGLLSVNIPKNVQEIAGFAFFKCEELKEAILPNNLTRLNHGLFQGCLKLEHVNIPSSLESTGNYVFGMCVNIKEAKFPEGFKHLGAGTFYNCSKLENISLPSSTTHVMHQPFEYCYKLKTVHFPSSLKYLGNQRGPFKYFEKCDDGFNLSQEETKNSIPMEDIRLNIALISRYWDKKNTLFNEQKHLNIRDFYNEYLIEQPEKVIDDFIYNHNFTFFKQLNIPNIPENRYELFNFLYNFGVMTLPIERNGKKIDYAQKTVGIILEKTRKDICDISKLKKMFLSMKSDGFKPEFTDYFIQNFDDLVGFEELIPGFTAWSYNEFEKVQKTNTSNRGSQRQLKPSIDAFFNYFSSKDFIGVTEENKHIAEAISMFFKEQETFNTALQIDEERRKSNVPNNILGFHLTESPFDKIDELANQTKQMQIGFLQDMVHVATNEFTFDWLEKNDPQNFILGKLCTCCAHIQGGGYSIMRASIIDPNVQNLVIKNKAGEIIAKSTLYINPHERYGVFNNIEVNDYVEEKDRPLIYQKFMLGAKRFAEEYNKQFPYRALRQINVGMNLNDLTPELEAYNEKSKFLLKAIDYSKYGITNAFYNGDSDLEQYVVWRNDEKSISPKITELGEE